MLTPVDIRTLTGIFLIVLSLILIGIARFQLGKSFAIFPQAKELKTHGLYSKIRHPIYVFGQLLFLGIILCVRHGFLWYMWLMLFVIQLIRARKEEQVLEEKFGTAYRDYKKSTWF